jgi:hypothetical protein
MAIETLFKNQWLTLKKVVAPERGISGYVFSHEERCQGCIIAVLPFRNIGSGYEYLIKSEVTPCWSLEPEESALTGGWEGKAPVEDAQRELHEESGYLMDIKKFIKLGQCYASKSSDTRFELYAVDLTGVSPGEVKGDGSRLEAEAKSLWKTEAQLLNVMDAQVHVMLNRLKAKLRG